MHVASFETSPGTCRHPDLLAVPLRRAHHRPMRRVLAPLSRERVRLRAHFREVLAELSARDVSELNVRQRAMRTELIAELVRYARAGRFPRNLDFPGRRIPYFVDAFGTRCAMAHLIESTGETELVARIAGTMNNALVPEMADNLALQAWLEQTGLTVAEAARIQPSYCFVAKGEQCFCNSVINPLGVLEATVVTKLTASQVSARVSMIHGNGVGTTVGQEITVSASDAAVSDTVLIQVSQNSQMMAAYGNVHRVQTSGNLELTCTLDIPSLAKTDAIAAMLSKEKSSGSDSACSEYLEKLNAKWGESICKTPGGQSGGCNVGATGGGSPLLLGTALAFAAMWQRRRRATSRR